MANQKVVLLLDGDILAFRAASATDGRQYTMKCEDSEGSIYTAVERYKKDIDKLTDKFVSEGYTIRQPPTISYEPEPLENAKHIVNKTIKSISDQLAVHFHGYSQDLKCYISRGDSFRNSIFPEYKLLRHDVHRPKHLDDLKVYLEGKYGAQCREGELEADDMIAMESTRLSLETDSTPVIVSLDKDFLQVPGYMFNFNSGKLICTTALEAHRNLYIQMLTGDSTDGIPGLKGIGPKKAEKILAGIQTEFDMYAAVLRAYIEHFPNKEPAVVQKFLSVNAQMLYLLRHEGDSYTIPQQGGPELDEREGLSTDLKEEAQETWEDLDAEG